MMNQFNVFCEIAVGRVMMIAPIAHNHCGVVNLTARKEQLAQGLIDHGG